MGAGASANTNLNEVVEANSPEAIQEAVDGLSAENRAKLTQALGLPAENGAAVAVAVAVAAPEEERVSAAPFLKQYFDIQMEAQSKMMEMIPTLLADPNPTDKMEGFRTSLCLKLKPPLEKSFQHHDTEKTGILSKDEASVFFKNFVDESQLFIKSVLAVTTRQGIEASVQMMPTMMETMFAPPPGQENEAGTEVAEPAMSPQEQAEFQQFFEMFLKPQIEETVKQTIEVATKKLDEQRADYEANKEERHKAAFAVMDKNGDGSLQYCEFEKILLGNPQEDEKVQQFMTALGFPPLDPQELVKNFSGALNFDMVVPGAEEAEGEGNINGVDECKQM